MRNRGEQPPIVELVHSELVKSLFGKWKTRRNVTATFRAWTVSAGGGAESRTIHIRADGDIHAFAGDPELVAWSSGGPPAQNNFEDYFIKKEILKMVNPLLGL